LEILPNARVEPAALTATGTFQFERLGYFCHDSNHSHPGKPVLNRAVTLKDTWARAQGKA
jgi:glutaminyl-tRNA synthetase